MIDEKSMADFIRKTIFKWLYWPPGPMTSMRFNTEMCEKDCEGFIGEKREKLTTYLIRYELNEIWLLVKHIELTVDGARMNETVRTDLDRSVNKIKDIIRSAAGDVVDTF